MNRHSLIAFVICISLLGLHMAKAGEVSDSWPALRDTSLYVEAGSALDFSSFNKLVPITERERLQVGKRGAMVLAASPDVPVRFLIASLGLSAAHGGYPDHPAIDLYVEQLVRRGYNMARLDFVEDTLMNGRQGDFDYDPVQLDRFDYLMAALRKAGVYAVLNVISSDNGAYGNIEKRWENKHNLLQRVYTDRVAQWHWRHLVETIMVRPNPYTGSPLLQDPVLAGLALANESGLEFLTRRGVPEEMRPLFAKWLQQRYGTPAAWREAWKSELGADEGNDWSKARFPQPADSPGARMADAQRFFASLQQETFGWMTRYLRENGFKGLITGLNDWLSPGANAARGQFDWVDMHNYHAHPDNWVQPGSHLPQTSSLAESGKFLDELAVSRHWGKAFTVTEYGQVFWNRYRREAALLVPAYAAFQGWDGIAQHAYAIESAYGLPGGNIKRAMHPFLVALDPISRVTETMAALLYRRGDVSPARHALSIRMTPRFAYEQSAFLWNMPVDISRLALLTGIGLTWVPDEKAPVPQASTATGKGAADAQIEPEVTLFSMGGRMFGSLVRRAGSELRWPDRVDALRRAGILSAGNRSDASAGIYQSDTEQLLLDASRKSLRVLTPRTEAVVLDMPRAEKLNVLSIDALSSGALLALSSLDGNELSSSRRMLLVVATDARNTGMRFSDANDERLQSLGTLPVRLRPVSTSISVRTRLADVQAWSVAQSGRRLDALPVRRSADGISLQIDTAALQSGPVTYVEIISKP